MKPELEPWSAVNREKNHSTDRLVLKHEREGTVEEKEVGGDGPAKGTAKRAEKGCQPVSTSLWNLGCPTNS